MTEIVAQLALCIERGKANRDSPYPPDLRGQDGAAELARAALEEGVPPGRILAEGLTRGMQAIGDRFAAGEAFIPEILMSARAMQAAMVHLEPHFASGSATHRGTVIIGTVAGDLHDIGKNIVRMVLEGNGWRVLDLGVDTTTERFLEALDEHPDAVVAMSALLTTTMVNMESSLAALREAHPDVRVYVGGAPVTDEFASRIGATGYYPDPHTFARHLTRDVP